MMLLLADKMKDNAHYSMQGIHRYIFSFLKTNVTKIPEENKVEVANALKKNKIRLFDKEVEQAKVSKSRDIEFFNKYLPMPQITVSNNVILIRDKCEGTTNSSIIHDKLGPNEYIVFVDGPELHAHVPEWSKECLYTSNISVSTNGKYEIKIYKTRTNFSAIDETMPPRWPELHYDVIYLQTHILNTSDSSESWCIWKASTSNYWSEPHSPGKPRNVTTRVMLDDVVPPRRMRNYGVAGVDVVPNLKDKSILFSGDSNMRTAMLDMMKVLKMVKQTYNIPSHVDHCVQKWCFKSNTMGTCLTNTSTYDFVVWNFGQHPASGQRWMTFSRYKKSIDSAVNCAKPFKEKLLWMETPPVPMRNDKWVHGYKDWRSYHRLKAFNVYATKSFEKIGVNIIPHWKMMLPLADKMNDQAHYSIQGVHRYIFSFLKI